MRCSVKEVGDRERDNEGTNQSSPESQSSFNHVERCIKKKSKTGQFAFARKSCSSSSSTVTVSSESNDLKKHSANSVKKLKDEKLVLIPTVVLNRVPVNHRSSASKPVLANKKKSAIMKLRKAPHQTEKKEKRVTSDSSESEEDDGQFNEDSLSSSSEESDSESDDAFATRTYPLRKKTSMKGFDPVRKRTPPRAGSASDSSSESLLDIPPPGYVPQKPSLPMPSSSTFHRNSIPNEKSTPKREESAVRKLRSSSSDACSAAGSSSISKSWKSRVEDESRKGKGTLVEGEKETQAGSSISSSSSPLKSLRPSSSVKPTSPTSKTPEQSYSFRNIEKRDKTSPVKTPVPEASNAVASSPLDAVAVVKKRPGRPKKDLDALAKLRSELDNLPPAKRTRRRVSTDFGGTSASASSQSTAVKGEAHFHPEEPEEQSESKWSQSRKFDSSKQQRDAIAQRARQSKIMAKSRVLQSNKYSLNSNWRQHMAGIRKTKDNNDSPDSDSSSPPVLNPISELESDSSSSPTPTAQSSEYDLKSETSSVGSGTLPSSPEKTLHPPVVSCDVCHLTFTRKFSLTKHLATRLHQRMVRKSALSAQGMRLGKSRRRRDLSPVHDEIENDDGQIEDEHVSPDSADVEDDVVEEDFPGWASGRPQNGGMFVCDVCGDVYINRADFSAHLWSHRSGSDLKCEECEMQFRESDAYNEHLSSAHITESRFACKICPSRFTREEYLIKHKESHRQDDQNKFICCECDKRFFTHDHLAKHFDLKHLHPKVELLLNEHFSQNNENLPKVTDNGQSLLGPLQPKKDRGLHHDLAGYQDGRPSYPVNCQHCGKIFRNRRDYPGSMCQACKSKFKGWRKPFRNSALRRNRNKGPLQPVLFYASRPVMKSSFFKKRRMGLMLGLSRPLSSLTVPFPVVGKNTDTLNAVGLQRSSGENIEALGLQSGGENLLSTSTNMTPSTAPRQIRPADRKISSAGKTSPTLLYRKTTFEPKSGQGYNLVHCERCPKVFTDQKTLTTHLWFHESPTLYACPECEAKCERKSDFDLHFKCHEKKQSFFVCYVCFKPFRWKKDMIRHVRKKHPDEKTYRCLYCNDRFQTNDDLTQHIAVSHAKHRSFPCTSCGKRYAQKRYLVLHVQSQHGIPPTGAEGESAGEDLLDMEEETEDGEIGPGDESLLNVDIEPVVLNESESNSQE